MDLTACVVGDVEVVRGVLEPHFNLAQIPTTPIDIDSPHSQRLSLYIYWVAMLDRADVVLTVTPLEVGNFWHPRIAWAMGYAYRAEKPIISLGLVGKSVDPMYIESVMAHVTDLDELRECLTLLVPVLGPRPVDDTLARTLMEVRAKYQLPYTQ